MNRAGLEARPGTEESPREIVFFLEEITNQNLLLYDSNTALTETEKSVTHMSLFSNTRHHIEGEMGGGGGDIEFDWHERSRSPASAIVHLLRVLCILSTTLCDLACCHAAGDNA